MSTQNSVLLWLPGSGADSLLQTARPLEGSTVFPVPWPASLSGMVCRNHLGVCVPGLTHSWVRAAGGCACCPLGVGLGAATLLSGLHLGEPHVLCQKPPVSLGPSNTFPSASRLFLKSPGRTQPLYRVNPQTDLRGAHCLIQRRAPRPASQCGWQVALPSVCAAAKTPAPVPLISDARGHFTGRRPIETRVRQPPAPGLSGFSEKAPP